MSDESSGAFRRVLDPEDNSTGGGAASALAGAMAAALTAMVARLSLAGAGPEADEYYIPVVEDGVRLAEDLRTGAEEDAAAFDAVMAAYQLPKATEEQKAQRTPAIRAAMQHATEVPLRNAEHCLAVLRLVAKLEGRSNPRALSDLQSASYLAAAALRGCLANVDINLPSVKDEKVAAPIRSRAEALRTVMSTF